MIVKLVNILLIICSLTCTLLAQSVARLEGVYQLISEETVIFGSGGTKLVSEIRTLRSSPEWSGLLRLQGGYFSYVLMKEHRTAPLDYQSDLGFETFTGKYKLRSNKIEFKQTYTLNPLFKGRPVVMSYTVEGRVLILRQELLPTIEENREGTITLKLVRLL